MKKIIIGLIVGVILTITIILALFFMLIHKSSESILNKTPVSGQGIYEGINAHRKSIGITPLKLDMRLCNNLSERRDVARAGNGSSGFEEWQQRSLKQGAFNRVIEIYASYEKNRKDMPEKTYPALEDFINPWMGSPGDKFAIENVDLTMTCTYSDGYTVIMILAN